MENIYRDTKIHDQNAKQQKKLNVVDDENSMIVNTIGARVYFSRMYGEKQIQKASHPPGPIAVSLLKRHSMCCIVQWLVGCLTGSLSLCVLWASTHACLLANTHRVSVSLWYVIEIVEIYIIRYIHIGRQAGRQASERNTPQRTRHKHTQSERGRDHWEASALETIGEHAYIKTHAHCQRRSPMAYTCTLLFFGSLRRSVFGICDRAVYIAVYCPLLYARSTKEHKTCCCCCCFCSVIPFKMHAKCTFHRACTIACAKYTKKHEICRERAGEQNVAVQ